MAWNHKMFQPVDAASLAFFRIGFGLCLIYQIRPHALGDSFYYAAAAPEPHIPYPLLDWIAPVSPEFMQVILLAMLVAAVGITIGLGYRLSATVYTVAAGYFHFMDSVRYHNHYFLMFLLVFFLALTPAHRVASMDRWLWYRSAPSTTPRWTIWWLRFNIGIPFFFSGLSKLNSEWLHGLPTIFFWGLLADRHAWARALNPEWMALFIAWGGALADVVLVPLLLWRRTRLIGLALAILFNLGNAILFSGDTLHVTSFPFIMIVGVTSFFEPDWPRRLWARLGARIRGRMGGAIEEPMTVSNAPGAGLDSAFEEMTPARRVIIGFLSAYVLLQVFLPLRYHLYPGFHLWNEFGRNHSWQMMASIKSGKTRFIVTDPDTGETWDLEPFADVYDERYLEFSRKPALIYEYAKRIKDRLARRGHPDCEVRVDAFASLNGRPTQRMIDPTVDITMLPPRWGYVSWVLPLEEPLPSLKEVAASISQRRGAKESADTK